MITTDMYTNTCQFLSWFLSLCLFLFSFSFLFFSFFIFIFIFFFSLVWSHWVRFLVSGCRRLVSWDMI